MILRTYVPSAPVRRRRAVVNPFKALEQLPDEISRLVGDMFTGVPGESWASKEGFMPRVELEETEKSVVLRAELPGVDAKDLEVNVLDDRVVLSGMKRTLRLDGEEVDPDSQAEREGVSKSEFFYGEFQRVVPLPAEVACEGECRCVLRDGVATIEMPKKEISSPTGRKLEITCE